MQCEHCQFEYMDATLEQREPNSAAIEHHQHCAFCQSEVSALLHVDESLRTEILLAPPASVYRRAFIAAVEIDRPPSFIQQHWWAASMALLCGILLTLAVSYLPLFASHFLLLLATFVVSAGMTFVICDWDILGAGE